MYGSNDDTSYKYYKQKRLKVWKEYIRCNVVMKCGYLFIMDDSMIYQKYFFIKIPPNHYSMIVFNGWFDQIMFYFQWPDDLIDTHDNFIFGD